MTSFAAAMALGLFLGMRHATDPDHVIAVTTIASRHRTPRAAAAIGAAWGLGHTVTILLVGGGIVVFGWVIPPRVGLSTELAVAAMLIVLGLTNLGGVVRDLDARVADGGARGRLHSHPQGEGDPESSLGWLDRRLGSLGPYRLVRPVVIGVVHGLAGSAALALLVLATISSPRWAILYLFVFGLGTILGMMLMTTAIVVPFKYADRRFARSSAILRVGCGIVSVAFGAFLAYRIGFVDGLFTADPRWTPH